MDKGKSAMPLLAIVAIVAVVAVVMVVLQGRTPSSEEAVAGEAIGISTAGCYTRYSATPTGMSGNDICKQYQRSCIFQEPWPLKLEDGTISTPALVYPRDCGEALEFSSVAVCCRFK